MTAWSNAFVERYNRIYQEECLAMDRPADLEQARTATETFTKHYNQQRPHQGLSCGNCPPRTAFPTLAPLPALPTTVDPDSWLSALDGLHLERKVNRHGMVSVDLKSYYVSSKLVGQHVVLHLDAQGRCVQVLHEQKVIKSLPLKGIVGRPLSFEHFWRICSTKPVPSVACALCKNSSTALPLSPLPSPTMCWP